MLAADEWWVPLSPIHPQFARTQDVAGRSQARGCAQWQRRRVDTRAARWERLLALQRDTGLSDGYSALFGVDMRDPTGDVRVAEFCLSLPEDQFRRAGVRRGLIRRAMADRLPAEVLASRPRALQGRGLVRAAVRRAGPGGRGNWPFWKRATSPRRCWTCPGCDGSWTAWTTPLRVSRHPIPRNCCWIMRLSCSEGS